jgi:hypothetical protein
MLSQAHRLADYVYGPTTLHCKLAASVPFAVDYETSPRRSLHSTACFPVIAQKKNSGSIFDMALKRWATTRCTRLSADQPVSLVRFDLILALFICFGYLDAHIDEPWNMAILLRFSHIRALRGCSGYNPYVFHNPAHHVFCARKTSVARLWIHFFGVLIRSSNRHDVNQDCFVINRLIIAQRILKFASLCGSFQIQCRWSGSNTYPSMTNGWVVCVFWILLRSAFRTFSLHRNVCRRYVTTVKKYVPHFVFARR